MDLRGCEGLTNELFGLISVHVTELTTLKLGGHDKSYNTVFSKKGLKWLDGCLLPLKTIQLDFCAKIGTSALEIIANNFSETLEELTIKRNCLESCAKISDESMVALSPCINLKRLSIIYTRKFGENAINIIAASFPKLEVLNLRECLIQSDFSVLG